MHFSSSWSRTITYTDADGVEGIPDFEHKAVKKKGSFSCPGGYYHYEGEIALRCKHGYGHQKWTNGDEYKGNYWFDQRNGFGVMKWRHGAIVYVGSFKEDQPWGDGLLVTSTQVFEGQFDRASKVRGTLLRLDLGEKYVGDFQLELMHGNGTYYYKEQNTVYRGSFANGKRDGRGTMNYANGNIYIGYWKENKWNGFGTLSWFNGDRYEGYFSEGLKSGYGALYFKNSETVERFEGVFREDKKLNGFMFKRDGSIIHQVFVDGVVLQRNDITDSFKTPTPGN